MMTPFLPPPGASFQVLHTPQSDQGRRQCEGAGGMHSQHCQQPGQMMPGFAYTPGLPAGLPQALKAPPCMEYCTFSDGRQSTFSRGSWQPPLTALMGIGNYIYGR